MCFVLTADFHSTYVVLVSFLKDLVNAFFEAAAGARARKCN